MIELEDINITFDNKVIYDNAQIKIKDHEFVCIKGLSGCGKSTLLFQIGLLDKLKCKYKLDDVFVTDKNKQDVRKKKFAYIFQDDCLIPYYSVYENMILALKNEKKKVDENLVLQVAQKLNISDILDSNSSILSGGEKQRVSIARAVLSDKGYFIIDEPTGNLDPENARQVMNLLAKIHIDYKKTMILVTHSNDFDQLFDRLFYIKDKKIYEKEL